MQPSTPAKNSQSDQNVFFPFKFLINFSSTLLVTLFFLPGVSLIIRAIMINSSNHKALLYEFITPLTLSLFTTAISVFFIFILGTPLAYNLARKKNPLKRIISIFIELPIVMPPVVAGLALLSTFGRSGLLGSALNIFGAQITFTPIAVIIAQIFVGAPFFIRSAQNRFSTIPNELEESARIDGASNWCIFRTIILPLSYKAIISGLILSWARSLGEFGATILFAGNLKGRTQTLPLFIYSSLEKDLGTTFTSASIMLIISLALFTITRILTRLDDEEKQLSGF